MVKMDFKSKNFDLPENMFYFYNDDLQPLSFVLDWDSEDKFYFNLLNRYFADVFYKPNEHSIVLAKPDVCKYFHEKIPAFDIKYIEDCFKHKDYLDPNPYYIENSCNVKYTKNSIFDCWYHQKKTWFDLIPIQEINDSDSSSGISELNWITYKNKRNCISSMSNNSSNNGIVKSKNSWKKKTRLPYSMKEDQDIIKFIVDNKYAFKVTGREMWEKMELANVCKIRTWQSMKERYIKHIKYDLMNRSSKFSFISSSDMKMLRQGLNIDALKLSDKEKIKSKLHDQRIESWNLDETI